jgi:cytochrome c-type biogenesis protein CcmH
MRKFRALLLFLLVAGSAAATTIEVYHFDNPEDEARYKQLVHELRCLVCQNQDLADSNAELAQDMRHRNYEMVQAGKSDEEIVAFMVERYGDFVLYRPPVKGSTLLLWVGPFIILGAGMVILVLFIRRRNREAVVPLSPKDHERARRLLREGETGDRS